MGSSKIKYEHGMIDGLRKFLEHHSGRNQSDQRRSFFCIQGQVCDGKGVEMFCPIRPFYTGSVYRKFKAQGTSEKDRKFI
jgi:hypothetical protein